MIVWKILCDCGCDCVGDFIDFVCDSGVHVGICGCDCFYDCIDIWVDCFGLYVMVGCLGVCV